MTQHPYRTQRGPRKADWALLAFILCAWGYVMHQDHQAELQQHHAEQRAKARAQQHQATVCLRMYGPHHAPAAAPSGHMVCTPDAATNPQPTTLVVAQGGGV